MYMYHIILQARRMAACLDIQILIIIIVLNIVKPITQNEVITFVVFV